MVRSCVLPSSTSNFPTYRGVGERGGSKVLKLGLILTLLTLLLRQLLIESLWVEVEDLATLVTSGKKGRQ